jgi:hypothetical protein
MKWSKIFKKILLLVLTMNISCHNEHYLTIKDKIDWVKLDMIKKYLDKKYVNDVHTDSLVNISIVVCGPQHPTLNKKIPLDTFLCNHKTDIGYNIDELWINGKKNNGIEYYFWIDAYYKDTPVLIKYSSKTVPLDNSDAEYYNNVFYQVKPHWWLVVENIQK